MAKSLADFLEELDTDSKLKEAYKKDPVGIAEKAGLSEEDVKLIKEKDWDKLSRQMEDMGKVLRVIDY